MQIKNNPTQTYAESPSYPVPKRQSKKPKKVQLLIVHEIQYIQNEEGTYHYNTRSRVNESNEKETNKEPEPDNQVQYCICGKVESDKMVQCDNENCKHKWFHYACVGIDDPHSLPQKWYCPECRKALESTQNQLSSISLFPSLCVLMPQNVFCNKLS